METVVSDAVGKATPTTVVGEDWAEHTVRITEYTSCSSHTHTDTHHAAKQIKGFYRYVFFSLSQAFWMLIHCGHIWKLGWSSGKGEEEHVIGAEVQKEEWGFAEGREVSFLLFMWKWISWKIQKKKKIMWKNKNTSLTRNRRSWEGKEEKSSHLSSLFSYYWGKEKVFGYADNRMDRSHMFKKWGQHRIAVEAIT